MFLTKIKSLFTGGAELDCHYEGKIKSRLRVDQDNYPDLLKKRLSLDEIDLEMGNLLIDFHNNGYCILNLDEDDSFYESMEADIERLWSSPPEDLLGVSPSINGGKLMSLSDLTQIEKQDEIRKPGSRIIDLHSHSKCAKKLYFHPKIHSVINEIIEQACVATQSLYFEYGSTQALHRDPWFVVTKQVENLVACWIALEDIELESGPLTYVPGSHKWPFLHDSKDNIILHAPHIKPDFKTAVYTHMKEQITKYDTCSLPFTAKKGQVFIWHGSLIHGGSPVKNGSLTRKSLVIHFDAKESADRRGSRFYTDNHEKVLYTNGPIEKNGYFGFKNPVEGFNK